MRALKEHGYRLPDDISFVGFDDMPLSYVVSPKLTTIQVAKELFGKRAVTRLAEKIQEQDGISLRISINPSLVVRNSTKSISASSRLI